MSKQILITKIKIHSSSEIKTFKVGENGLKEILNYGENGYSLYFEDNSRLIFKGNFGFVELLEEVHIEGTKINYPEGCRKWNL